MITFHSIHVVIHGIINTGHPMKDVEKAPVCISLLKTA